MNILFYGMLSVSIPPAAGEATLNLLLSQDLTRNGHCCYSAYYEEISGKKASFDDSICLSPTKEKESLEDFIIRHNIDMVVLQWNFSNKNFYILDMLSEIRKKRPFKIIHFINTLPFTEITGYDFDYVVYILKFSRPIKTAIKDFLWSVSCWLKLPYTMRRVAKRYHYSCDRCDKVVLLSSYYIDNYMTHVRCDKNKIRSILPPLVANATICNNDNYKKEKLVVVIARFNEQSKRVSRAIKIWKLIEKKYQVKDWRLEIVGYGKDELYYKQLAERYGLKQIRFVGRQSSTEWLKRAEIIMNTSAHEGVPMTIIEAKQLQVIPMSFDSYGGVHELIRHNQNGIIVPDGNLKTYAKELYELLSDESKRASLRMHLADGLDKFSPENVIAQWNKLISECAKE